MDRRRAMRASALHFSLFARTRSGHQDTATDARNRFTYQRSIFSGGEGAKRARALLDGESEFIRAATRDAGLPRFTAAFEAGRAAARRLRIADRAGY
jgi:hypothetical protein